VKEKAMPSKKPKGPEFVRFFQPVLAALAELGGSGSPGEVCDLVADALGTSEERLSEQLKNGSSRFRNQVAWARFYLVKADLVDASVRGVWSLTARGRRTTLSHNEAYGLFKEIHAKWPPQKKSDKGANESDDISPEEASEASEGGHREQLMGIHHGAVSGGL
jgi:restriction system protein